MGNGKQAVVPDLKGLFIHGRQLADLTGYDEKQFRRLAAQNYFPSPNKGLYELIPVLRGMFRFFKELSVKNNRPDREDKKDQKLSLEVQALQKSRDVEDGKLLTLDEWRVLTTETLPPIVQMVSNLFRIEIPANCSGQGEAAIRAWGIKREAEIRRTLRGAEKEFDPAQVVRKRGDEEMKIHGPRGPFEIPYFVGRVIFSVGISGGKDSAAVLAWLVRESGIDPALISAHFCDIGNDHPATLEHVQWLSDNVHPVETIYPELNFFDLALSKRRFPSANARFCTEYLKIYPAAGQVQKLKEGGKVSPVAVSGVRADESLERQDLPEWDFSATLNCPSWRPLIAWTLQDVFDIHKRQNIPLNPLYEMGAKRVGCWPCIFSAKEEIRIIAMRFPERIDELRKQEQFVSTANGRLAATFFNRDKVPARFRTLPYVTGEGREMLIASIDDVVRWAMTGKGAKGSYLDDTPDPEEYEPVTCKSGFCE